MTRRIALLAVLAAVMSRADAAPKTITYPLDVLPPEHRIMQDAKTGAKLIFLMTGPDRDNNLYFHQRSFLSDDSMALFESKRKKTGGLMGYLFATGEVVRIYTPKGKVGNPTAAKTGNRVYGTRKNEIFELTLKTSLSKDPTVRSRVVCTERMITTVGGGIKASGHLTENSNGTLLSSSADLPDGMHGVITIDVKTGQVKVVARIKPEIDHGHVQFSHTSPYLLSYASEPRINVVDLRTGKARAVYHELPGELVTHESWWVNDQITFAGGFRKGESDVKVLNPKTGIVRVIGKGAWWPDASQAELAKWNWWHTNGHDSGRWVAADNWYGTIMVFDAKTTRAIPVSYGHRPYGGAGLGQGDHPHVGWDRSGKRVIFSSLMLGGVPHTCVAYIPTKP